MASFEVVIDDEETAELGPALTQAKRRFRDYYR